ncbi:hypothetical protein VNO77_19076 [Canavalia gladiata]|uniref:Uncharacterized protein n=1 Tax=Canavalia gladiata TaxID=3824 RepID=A0AAN9QL17_CANGL
MSQWKAQRKGKEARPLQHYRQTSPPVGEDPRILRIAVLTFGTRSIPQHRDHSIAKKPFSHLFGAISSESVTEEGYVASSKIGVEPLLAAPIVSPNSSRIPLESCRVSRP